MTLTDFGINATATGWPAPWGGAEIEDIPRMMREIAAVGATRVRIGAPWSWIVDKRDNYLWNNLPTAIEAAVDNGLKPLICFDRLPGGPKVEEFGELCQATAQMFGDVVDEWEIFNEVNSAGYFPGVDPLKYLGYLRAAYTALHEVQPDCTVVTAGLVAGCEDDPIPFLRRTCSPVTWYRKLYENGAKDLFDALGMHLYCADANSKLLPVSTDSIPFRHFEAVRALMVQYGDSAKKIWVTEWGCEHIRAGVNGQRDRVAAQIPIMQNYRDLGWLGPEFAFNIRDWKKKTDKKESSHFGMLWYDDWSRKPIYYVWQGYAQRGLIPAGQATAVMPTPDISVVVDPNLINVSAPASAVIPVPNVAVAELLPSGAAEAAMPVPDITYLTKPRRISAGAGGRNSTSNSTTISTSWTHTMAGGSAGHLLIVGFCVSYDAQWDWSNYDTLSVTSSIDGALTRLASRYTGSASFKNGSVHLFGLWNPSPGAHTITCTVAESSVLFTDFEQIMGNSAEYIGVGGINNATSEGSGAWTMSMDVASAVDNIAVCAAAFSNTYGTFSKNVIHTDGSSVPGNADYMVLGDAVATSTKVNFAVTSNRAYGAVGINLTKIAA